MASQIFSYRHVAYPAIYLYRHLPFYRPVYQTFDHCFGFQVLAEGLAWSP
jgi:hypothetical protein